MNILTFDIEEWFHLLDNTSTKTEKEWNGYPSRIHENMDRIFDILDRNNQKATFFIIGWIARQYPEVVRRIHDRGYDIGFHTDSHQLIHELTPEEFFQDLTIGLDCIENIIGKKVIAFRAPGFSLTEKCNWAFDILAEQGIVYDCSVFPIKHAHGGYPSFPSIAPTLIKTDKGDIKEFPINVVNILGRSMVFTGGGYFRLLPYWLIRHYTKKSSYIMSYFHPRDMDPGQPVIEDLSILRRFRSYVGLKHAAAKFEKWITDFTFIDLHTASSFIDWSKVPVVDLRKK